MPRPARHGAQSPTGDSPGRSPPTSPSQAPLPAPMMPFAAPAAHAPPSGHQTNPIAPLKLHPETSPSAASHASSHTHRSISKRQGWSPFSSGLHALRSSRPTRVRSLSAPGTAPQGLPGAPPAAAGHHEFRTVQSSGPIRRNHRFDVTTHMRHHAYAHQFQSSLEPLRNCPANQDPDAQFAQAAHHLVRLLLKEHHLLALQFGFAFQANKKQARRHVKDRRHTALTVGNRNQHPCRSASFMPAPTWVAEESKSPLKSGGPQRLIRPEGGYSVAKCNGRQGWSVAICVAAEPRGRQQLLVWIKSARRGWAPGLQEGGFVGFVGRVPSPGGV